MFWCSCHLIENAYLCYPMLGNLGAHMDSESGGMLGSPMRMGCHRNCRLVCDMDNLDVSEEFLGFMAQANTNICAYMLRFSARFHLLPDP